MVDYPSNAPAGVTFTSDPRLNALGAGIGVSPGGDYASGLAAQTAMAQGGGGGGFSAPAATGTAPAATPTPAAAAPAPAAPLAVTDNGQGAEAAHQAIALASQPAMPPPPTIVGGDLLPAEGINGIVFHHTAGRGTPEGVINTLHQRGLGVQYIIDRDGTVYRTPWGAGASQMKRGWGERGTGLSNKNTYGVEVIANDDADVTPEQVVSGQSLIANYYPTVPVFGHGEVNPGHKQPTEGMSIVHAIRGGGFGIDPFAYATTYGAGGPARGGTFERDPQGNPVPPANIPGGMNVPPGLSTGSAPAYVTLTTGAADLGIAPLSPLIAAAGIGNIQQESSFNPTAKGKGGEMGYGQWDATRWANAQTWAKANGLDINDPRAQTLFWSHELQSDKNTWSRLQTAKTPAEATAIIAKYFERAGNPQMNKRTAYADAAFTNYGAAAPGEVDYSIPGAGFLTGPNMPSVQPVARGVPGASGAAPMPRTSPRSPEMMRTPPGGGLTGEEVRARAYAGRDIPTPRQRPNPFNIDHVVGVPAGHVIDPKTNLLKSGRIGPSYAEGGDVTLKGPGPFLPGTAGGPSLEAEQPIGPGSSIMVNRGDNLWTIAQTYLGDSTKAKEIAQLNGIRDPRALQPGQVLRLPGGMAAANIPTPRQRPGAPAAETDVFAGTDRTGVPATRQPVGSDFPGSGVSTSGPVGNAFQIGTTANARDMALMGGTGAAPGSRGSIGTAGHDIFERQAMDYARGLLDEGIGIGGEPPFNATSSRGIGARNASDMLWGDTEAAYLASGATGIEGEPDYHPQLPPPASDLARQPAAAMRLPNSGAAFAREREWDPIVASMAARNRRLQLEALLRGNPDYAEGLRAY